MFHLSDLSPAGWAVAALAALLIGVTKTGVPGLGILVVPMMAAIMPAKTSTGAVLPMLILGDCFAVAWHRRHAVWPHVLRLMPWALAGIVAGCLALNRISDRQLQPVIGVIILGLLVLSSFQNRQAGRPIPTQWWFAAFLGILAGVVTMISNAAGPIMMLYLLAMRLDKHEFLGTGAWYFLILNVVKIPFSYGAGALTAQTLSLNLILVPPIVGGAFLGLFLFRRIPERLFGPLIIALTVAASIRLILPAQALSFFK